MTEQIQVSDSRMPVGKARESVVGRLQVICDELELEYSKQVEEALEAKIQELEEKNEIKAFVEKRFSVAND